MRVKRRVYNKPENIPIVINCIISRNPSKAFMISGELVGRSPPCSAFIAGHRAHKPLV